MTWMNYPDQRPARYCRKKSFRAGAPSSEKDSSLLLTLLSIRKIKAPITSKPMAAGLVQMAG